jgi:hypothetical protein
MPSIHIATLAIGALGLGGLLGLSGGDAEAARGDVPNPGAEKSEASSPRPSCFAGSVRLGPRAGAVDFRARCRPTAPSGIVNVAVSHTTRGGSQFAPVKAFRRFPLLKAGGEVRRGRCVRGRGSSGQILCSAKIEGSAVLEGRIWVGAEERCAGEVQLVSSPSYEPCRGVCAAVLPPSTLIVRGPPRGC